MPHLKKSRVQGPENKEDVLCSPDQANLLKDLPFLPLRTEAEVEKCK